MCVGSSPHLRTRDAPPPTKPQYAHHLLQYADLVHVTYEVEHRAVQLGVRVELGAGRQRGEEGGRVGRL
jgi:hypothetical protein